MLCKNALAAIDHNMNTDRAQVYSYLSSLRVNDILQGRTAYGVLQFDLVTSRDGAKYYVKPKKEAKDMTWKDSIASVALKVDFVMSN